MYWRAVEDKRLGPREVARKGRDNVLKSSFTAHVVGTRSGNKTCMRQARFGKTHTSLMLSFTDISTEIVCSGRLSNTIDQFLAADLPVLHVLHPLDHPIQPILAYLLIVCRDLPLLDKFLRHGHKLLRVLEVFLRSGDLVGPELEGLAHDGVHQGTGALDIFAWAFYRQNDTVLATCLARQGVRAELCAGLLADRVPCEFELIVCHIADLRGRLRVVVVVGFGRAEGLDVLEVAW